MRHPLAAFALLLSTAACQHGPDIREGPPLHVTFGPPTGGSLVEDWSQVRDVTVEFPETDDKRVVERLEGRTLESYEPLPDGGWRVVSTVLDEKATRDGVLVTSPLPLAGVPFVHAIDRTGRFVTALEIDETLREIRERVHDEGLRSLLLDNVFTPENIAARSSRGWDNRFGGLCGRELPRGEVLWSVEEQVLPIGGSARMVVKRIVVGDAEVDGRRVVELAVQFGGGRSDLASENGAFDALQPVGGRGTLTPRLEGKGVRFVDVDTCQTVREQASFEGDLALNREAAQKAGWTGFPERVRFRITREVKRSKRGGA